MACSLFITSWGDVVVRTFVTLLVDLSLFPLPSPTIDFKNAAHGSALRLAI